MMDRDFPQNWGSCGRLCSQFTRGVIAVALALKVFGAPPAQAEFKVCNQTLNLYNIAIGREINRSFYTEGWWTLPANNCVSPIKEDLDILKLRYVYVFATTIYGDDALTGDWQMCVAAKKFKIPKVPGEPWNCWIRGYQQAKFKEVDTGNAKSWTVFIRETQN